jgi:hypothetical protein
LKRQIEETQTYAFPCSAPPYHPVSDNQMTASTYLDRAFADAHAEIVGAGKSERIRYVAVDHSERWSDPGCALKRKPFSRWEKVPAGG